MNLPEKNPVCGISDRLEREGKEGERRRRKRINKGRRRGEKREREDKKRKKGEIRFITVCVLFVGINTVRMIFNYGGRGD